MRCAHQRVERVVDVGDEVDLARLGRDRARVVEALARDRAGLARDRGREREQLAHVAAPEPEQRRARARRCARRSPRPTRVMELGETVDHVRDPGRLVAASAVRNRREQRRVGLDQQALERQRLRHRAQLGRVVEREDAGERDVEAAREAVVARTRRSPVKQWITPPTCSAPASSKIARISSKASRVSRLGRTWITSGWPTRAREPDLRAQRLALRVARRVLVPVVEPALADRDHARVCEPAVERGLRDRAPLGGVVRVHADAGPDVRRSRRRA